MFSLIAKILLASKVRHDNNLRQKKFMPWDKIEKIALIINKEATVNKSAIDKFIDDTKKYIEVFYIETKSKHASFGDWKCFLKKDSSILNLPKKTIEAELKHKRYDLVINTCKANNLFSAYLSSSLAASFKCASSGRFMDADLIIRRADPDNLLDFLKDTVHYLKMIRV